MTNALEMVQALLPSYYICWDFGVRHQISISNREVARVCLNCEISNFFNNMCHLTSIQNQEDRMLKL